MDKSRKQILGAIIGVLAFIIIGFILPPPAGLTRAGMEALGIICLTVSLLTGQSLPDYVSVLLMCTLTVAFGIAPIGTAFSAFAGSTFWLIVGILAIGVAINKSGLLKRLALKAMTLFPPTFRGMVAALLGVGTIFAPLMPSTSAKQAIMGPIAMGIGETLGFEKKSKGMAGMFNAMYVGWSVTGTVFLSASFLTPIIMGALPPNIQAQFTWTPWFLGMIPWCVGLIVLSFFGLTILYKPETNNQISKDYIKAQIEKLGPMSRDEKISLIVLLICVALWVTESYHPKISTFIVAIGGLVAFVVFRVFSAEDFQTKMPWGLIFLVGGIINMAPILTYNKVDKWLGALFTPIASGVISNPYLFIFVLILITYAIRFVIPDLIAPMVVLTTVLTPVVQIAGWNPWVVAVATYCSVFSWCLIFQNSNFLVGWAACGGDEQNDFNKVKLGSWLYMAINIIAMLISVPYWQYLGYIPK